MRRFRAGPCCFINYRDIASHEPKDAIGQVADGNCLANTQVDRQAFNRDGGFGCGHHTRTRIADIGQVALGITLLGVLATVVLEFPPAWKVLRGGPLPRGVAYHSEHAA